MRSNMSRRRFLGVSGGALAGLALAGCSGNSGGVQQPGGGNLPDMAQGRTRVVVWNAFPDELGTAFQKIVDDFNGSQEDIYVDNQFQGSYEETAQKLSQALTARQIPDIAVLSDVTWNNFYFNDSLQPMNDYFGGGFSPNEYVDSLINEGTKDGRVYWTPFARSTPLFYYNRDMFEEAGLPDRGPETWDELRQWGAEIVKLDGNPKAHAFTTADNYNAWYFQGNVWQWNGEYSDDKLNIRIDDGAAVAAGEFVREFVNEDKFGYVAKEGDVDFSNGITATTLQSTGSLGGITESARFDVGTAFLPEQDGFGCPTGGSGLGIMSAAPDERKQAAFELIKFAASPENAAYWAQTTGYMPVTKSAADSGGMKDYFKKNPNFEVAVRQLSRTRPQDPARTIVPNGDQTIGRGLEQIFSNNQPAERAFADVASQLEQDAEDVKKKL